LRESNQITVASCRSGGHEISWIVNADSDDDALALLPFYVAGRTTATLVTEIEVQ
jgi:hypothetical protein